MLLTIHNLPSQIRYSDVKNLLQEKCSLSDLILDNMLPEGNTKRVTVGVSTEVDAAILVRKINGLYMQGQQLYVEDIRKNRETEQPFRSSSMPEMVPPQRFQIQAEQRYTNQPGMQQGYPATDESIGVQAQYMVQQPMPLNNYSMMGYCMPQMQDPNYFGYQNQAFIPGMQALPEIPAMQEQFKTNNSNQSWSSRQHQPVSYDNKPAQTNNSQDRWRNDRPRSRSPHRGGFQEQSRSHDQAKPQRNDHADKNDYNRRRSPSWQRQQDQYNSVRNVDTSFGRKRSPPRNRERFEPYRGLEFDRNAQIGSMFSMTMTSINSHQNRTPLEPPMPRPPTFEKPVSRPERLSRPEPYGGNPRGPGSRTQAPNSRFHEQKAPRFEEPRNRKNQFTNGQQRRPREEHQGNFGSARFSDGWRDRNSEPPVKNTRPSDRGNPAWQQPLSLEKKMKRHETRKGQAAAVISKDIIQNVQSKTKCIPEINEIKALRQAIRARLDVLLGNNMEVDNQEMVIKYRTKYGRNTDIRLFNLVLVGSKKEQEALKAADISALPPADDKPVILAPAKQNPSKEPAAAPKPTTPNKKVVQVPAGKLPRFPKGDKKVFQQQKQIQKKEFAGEIEYTLQPSMQAALDSEMCAIKDIIDAECKNPQDDIEKLVCKQINSKAADELKNVLGLTLTKRILNINTNLLVRVFFSPKMPKRGSIEAFLKKYGVIASKNSVKNKMYIATVNTYKNYDRLIHLGQTNIDGMTVSFKPLHITGPPSKMSKDQTKNRQTKGFNKQDEDQDKMQDDNKDTVEEACDENVEKEHFEMEDTDDEQSNDEAEYAHIDEVELSNVNADDLEDY